jgi:hypothetical protein
MGWLFNTRPQEKHAFVDECLADFRRHYSILDSAVRGRQLWILAEGQQWQLVIVLYLLDRHDGCWGCRSLTEADGPLYYDVPLRWFDRVPVVNQRWRDEVRSRHDLKRKPRPQVGERIIVPATLFPSIAGEWLVYLDLGRKGIGISDGKGTRYRIPAKDIKYVERVAPAITA